MAAKKASTKKANTKKDLETKIAELEAKLSKKSVRLPKLHYIHAIVTSP